MTINTLFCALSLVVFSANAMDSKSGFSGLSNGKGPSSTRFAPKKITGPVVQQTKNSNGRKTAAKKTTAINKQSDQKLAELATKFAEVDKSTLKTEIKSNKPLYLETDYEDKLFIKELADVTPRQRSLSAPQTKRTSRTYIGTPMPKKGISHISSTNPMKLVIACDNAVERGDTNIINNVISDYTLSRQVLEFRPYETNHLDGQAKENLKSFNENIVSIQKKILSKK